MCHSGCESINLFYRMEISFYIRGNIYIRGCLHPTYDVPEGLLFFCTFLGLGWRVVLPNQGENLSQSTLDELEFPLDLIFEVFVSESLISRALPHLSDSEGPLGSGSGHRRGA